jgi:hypothetical protein
MVMSGERLSPHERRSRLVVLISDHVIDGYEVVDRAETWAEMYKPKQFNLRGCLLGLGVFYLLRYALFEQEDAVRLEVTAQGDAKIEHIPLGRAGRQRR